MLAGDYVACGSLDRYYIEVGGARARSFIINPLFGAENGSKDVNKNLILSSVCIGTVRLRW